MKKIWQAGCFTVLFLMVGTMFSSGSFVAAAEVIEWPAHTEVEPTKTWTVTFNGEIAQNQENSISVLDDNGNEVDVQNKVSADRRQVLVYSPPGGYKEGAAYTLYIGEIVNEAGQTSAPVSMRFTVAEAAKPVVDLESEVYTFSAIQLGDDAAKLQAVLGKADRILPSGQGFIWHSYTKSYDSFAQYGVMNNKIVAIYSNANHWSSAMGVKRGLTQQAVQFLYKEAEEVYFHSSQNNETYYHGTHATRVYYDQHAYQMVDAVLTVAQPNLLESSLELNDAVLRSIEWQVFDMANAARAVHGKAPYEWNNAVAAAARAHSQDMADRSYFAHNTPEGRTPWDRLDAANISFCGGAENIALGYRTAMDVHQGWMNSEGHRRNLLNQLTDLGVGITQKNNRLYFTQNMISGCTN